MNKSRSIHPPLGQVGIATAAIGSLAIILAGGLAVCGLLDPIDAWFRNGIPSAAATQTLPAAVIWLGAAVVAYGLAMAMLGSSGIWRQMVVWITSLVLIAVWAPVLGLASYQINVAPWLVAAIWSGVCSLAYVRSYRMSCDSSPHVASELPPVG